MTGLDLDRIEATARAAAEAVSAEIWHLDTGRATGVYTEARPSPTSEDVASAYHREVESHVATMDPATTLALVARVREAEVALEGRCLADITLRDDDHRMVICILPEGHTFEHDDGMGCLWTDGGHGQADPATTRAPVERLRAAEARLAAVDALHVAEYDDGPEVNVCFDDRAEWPCLTHLAIHPECDGADHCQHVGGAA